MKITDIQTVIVNAKMRNWVFVKVLTDEGLAGWGEASLEWRTRGVVGCIEDMRPFVVGLDPTNIEHLWQVMTRHPFFRPGAVGYSAISGGDDGAGAAVGRGRVYGDQGARRAAHRAAGRVCDRRARGGVDGGAAGRMRGRVLWRGRGP